MVKAYKNNTLDYGFEYGNFFNYDNDAKKVCIQWVDNEEMCDLVVKNLTQALNIIKKIVKNKGHIDKNKYNYQIVGIINERGITLYEEAR